MKSLDEYDIDSKLTKIRRLFEWYMANNASQIFYRPKQPSFKYTLASSGGNEEQLLNNLSNDMRMVYAKHFTRVEVDIAVTEIHNTSLYSITIEVSCDGTLLVESITVDGIRLVNENAYKDAYLKYLKK